jgi:hypothetical protein
MCAEGIGPGSRMRPAIPDGVGRLAQSPSRISLGLPATLYGVTDDELTDAWESGREFPGGVSHPQHLRSAWVLHRRHGPEEARRRLVNGTKRACEVHGCPEKFDAALTERWARAIADGCERDGLGPNPDHFIATHPELRRRDLFGEPRGLG